MFYPIHRIYHTMIKKKLTMSEVKKMPPSFLLRIINKAKKELKKDKVMQSLFKKYNIDIDEIDYIPTFFKKLNVSAKTDHAIVWLNYSLLLDGYFDKKDFSYLIHEYTHWLQQTTGTGPTQSSDYGGYLDNPYEQEGFTNQVKYIANHEGEEEAENYVDNLLEHHDVKDKKEKDELEAIFLKKI